MVTLNPDNNVRSSLYIYAGNFSFLLGGSLFYILIARFLPVASIGIIALSGAIVSFLTVIFSLGIDYGFQHYISYYIGKSDFSGARYIIRISLLLIVILSIIVFASGWIFSGPISIIFFHSIIFEPVVKLLGVYASLELYFMLIPSVISGAQKFVQSSILTIIGFACIYGFPILFLLFKQTIYSVIYGWIIGSAIAAVISITFLYQLTRKISNEYMKQDNLMRSLFIYSFPLFISSLVSLSSTFVDRFILAYLTNLSNLGIYIYALTATNAVSVLASPFSTMLLPKFSAFYSKMDLTSLRKYVGFMVVLISFIYIPAAIGLAAIAKPFLILIVGDSYTSASLPLTIILLVSSIFIPRIVINSAVSSVRFTKVFMVSTLCALVSNILLSFLLIPYLGIVGAAIANSSVYPVSFIIVTFAAFKLKIARFRILSEVKIWVSAIAMYFAITFLLPFLHGTLISVLVPILVGSVLYYAMIRITKPLSNEIATFIMESIPFKHYALRRIFSLLVGNNVE